MSEYTPTTEQVREHCWRSVGGDEFDRWLASVKAKVWDEAIDGWSQNYDAYRANPYRR